mmetsp:Transcript_7556/g.9098  ORF Transcript_7556/g.9098 Transcript_7556/m.9098 type:complete len:342 (-) Transcript_7556:2023-3048(-)
MVEIEFLSDSEEEDKVESDDELMENIKAFREGKLSPKAQSPVKIPGESFVADDGNAMVLSPKGSKKIAETNVPESKSSADEESNSQEMKAVNLETKLETEVCLKTVDSLAPDVETLLKEHEYDVETKKAHDHIPTPAPLDKRAEGEMSVPDFIESPLIVDEKANIPCEETEAATQVSIESEKESRSVEDSEKMNDKADEIDLRTESQNSTEIESDLMEEKTSQEEEGVDKEIPLPELAFDVDQPDYSGSKAREYNVRTYGSKPGAVSIDSPTEKDVKYPHVFKWKSFWKPTWCDVCKSLMVGVYKQGLQCSECKQNVHYECMELSDHELPCVQSVVQTCSF